MKYLLLFCLLFSGSLLPAQQNPGRAKLRVRLSFQPDSAFNALPCHVYLADDDSNRVVYIGKTAVLDTVIDFTNNLTVIAWADGFSLRHEFLYPHQGAAVFSDTINLLPAVPNPAAVGFNTVCPDCDNTPVYRFMRAYMQAHPTDKFKLEWLCDAAEEKDKILIAESKVFMEAEIPKALQTGIDAKKTSFTYTRHYESLGCGMALQGLSEKELRMRYYGVLFTAIPATDRGNR